MSTNKSLYFYWIALGAIILAGLYYRLHGLALWGFTSADEYYMAKSVQNILKYGLPKFDTGGYYTRGILYQYISAGFIKIGFEDIFALRFTAVLANIISVPLVFLIGKKYGGKNVALIASILFLLSSWEVEYSRFSRYYTLFQLFFLYHLYLIYKVIFENRNDLFKWALIVSFISIFTYEGGIFLLVINFLPFIIKQKFDIPRIISAIFVLGISVLIIKFDFRQYGVTDQLPPDIILPQNFTSGLIYFPPALVNTFQSINIWLLTFGLLALALFYYSIKVNCISENNIQLNFVLAISVILFLINQITFGLLILILGYLYNWITLPEIKSKFKYLLIVLISPTLFWLIYLFVSKDWFYFYKDLDKFSAKNIFWIFLNYPDIYQQVILPWLKPLPYLTMIITFVIVVYFILTLLKDFNLKFNYEKEKYSFFLGTFLLLILGVAAIVTPYHVGRYTFFIHPIVLIIFSYSLYKIFEFVKTEKIRIFFIIIFIILTMFISRDYDLEHFLNISSSKEHFKEGYPKAQATMYYLREDYKTVADYINKHADKKDIVITTVAPIEYYINKLDYYFRDYSDIEFPIRSREYGKTELWTNSKLIYKKSDLILLLKKNVRTKWLITYSPKREYVSQFEIKLNKKYKSNITFRNINNTIVVYRIY